MITAGPSRSTVTLTVAVDSWPMRSLARTWMTLAPGASAATCVKGRVGAAASISSA
jgi:hypothetical protein